MNSDRRIIIVFSEPPPQYRFRPSISGTAWWRKTNTPEQAQRLAAKLRGLDIRGIIKPDKRTARENRIKKSPARPDAHKISSQGLPVHRYPFPEALREAARLDRR